MPRVFFDAEIQDSVTPTASMQQRPASTEKLQWLGPDENLRERVQPKEEIRQTRLTFGIVNNIR